MTFIQFNNKINDKLTSLFKNEFIIQTNCFFSLSFIAGEQEASSSASSSVIAGNCVQSLADSPQKNTRKRRSAGKLDDDEILSKNHIVVFDSKKSGTRCKFNKCNQTVFSFCSKCKIYLCAMRQRNCFLQYHCQILKSAKNPKNQKS